MVERGPLVVIPCLDERWTLPSVLDVLLAEADQLDALFVVADGGSTDGTIAWVEAQAACNSRLQLFNNVKRLQSSAVNDAVTVFGSDRRWMVRIDAHAEYPPSYLSDLITAALANEAQSVVVPMQTRGVKCFQKAAAAAQNSLLGTGGARHRWSGRSGWVDHGHHALFDLEWFKRMGGYNESFRANEDAEYDIRLGNAGGRIWMAANCKVTYYPRTSVPALYRQYERNGSGRAKTMLLHGSRLRLRQLGPILIAPLVALALATPLSFLFALPAMVWALVSLCYGALLGKGPASQCERMAGIPAIVMHLAWSVGFWKEILLRPQQQCRPLGFMSESKSESN